MLSNSNVSHTRVECDDRFSIFFLRIDGSFSPCIVDVMVLRVFRGLGRGSCDIPEANHDNWCEICGKDDISLDSEDSLNHTARVASHEPSVTDVFYVISRQT